MKHLNVSHVVGVFAWQIVEGEVVTVYFLIISVSLQSKWRDR